MQPGVFGTLLKSRDYINDYITVIMIVSHVIGMPFEIRIFFLKNVYTKDFKKIAAYENISTRR